MEEAVTAFFFQLLQMGNSGTPAARMKKVPSAVVKKRSRELTSIFEAFTPYNGMEGRVERIWINEIATDGIHLVGHTKGYVQVLVIAPRSLMGMSAIVKITSVGRWSVFGELIETLNQRNDDIPLKEEKFSPAKCSPCSVPGEICSCSTEPETCACEPQSCEGKISREGGSVSRKDMLPEDQNSQSLFKWLLRKRKNYRQKMAENELALGSKNKEERGQGSVNSWDLVDRILLGGIFVSIFTILALILHLGFW